MVDGLGIGRRKLIASIINQNWGLLPEEKTFTYNEVLYVIQEMVDEEGKHYQQPGNPNTGFYIFKDFAKHLMYRNIANFDSMVLLTSEKGTGKSSAAIMLAREICKLLGIRFNPKRHIAYNNADVMNKIDSLNNFEPLIADEAVRFACLDGNTLIKLPNGEEKIKNLVGKENFEVVSFNEKTKKEEIKIAEKCVKTKIDYVYEIETEEGIKIKATKDHKFLTTNGWKKLEELNEGDELIGT